MCNPQLEVIDDNKILTLVSNERIPFNPMMRMLLEIQDMKHASPATISRGGVLFTNGLTLATSLTSSRGVRKWTLQPRVRST